MFWAVLAAAAVLGVAALLAMVAVGGSGGGGPSRPGEIEDTYPRPGDQILSQGEVGADVPQGWSFRLFIDDTAIPLSDIESVPQLGQYRFKPRPGRVIERLPRGPHTARVETGPPGLGPTVTYSWSFRVGP